MACGNVWQKPENAFFWSSLILGAPFDRSLLYRTSGVIFFIDYCTAPRDTWKRWKEEKETLK